jgi:type 1 fimbria pilin
MQAMRKFLLLTFIAFLFSQTTFSQVLNGRVMNESGGNAANVSVRFQNKSNSIATKADGSFKITATKLPDTLVFSAAGYEPYKVVINLK